MLFHTFYGTILVRSCFCVEHLLTDPDWALVDVQERIFIFRLEWIEPAVFGFNFIQAHKIIIIAILIIVELELLIKFNVISDWSLMKIIFILKIYAFRDEVL